MRPSTALEKLQAERVTELEAQLERRGWELRRAQLEVQNLRAALARPRLMPVGANKGLVVEVDRDGDAWTAELPGIDGARGRRTRPGAAVAEAIELALAKETGALAKEIAKLAEQLEAVLAAPEAQRPGALTSLGEGAGG